jgi:hypothetical protein
MEACLATEWVGERKSYYSRARIIHKLGTTIVECRRQPKIRAVPPNLHTAESFESGSDAEKGD